MKEDIDFTTNMDEWMRQYQSAFDEFSRIIQSLSDTVSEEIQTIDPDIEVTILGENDTIQINGRTYDKDGKETPESIKKRSRKPPSDGPCKGCGKNLPLNRLMLCFKCWVNKNLSDWAKAEGNDFIPNIDPHPAWCHCGLAEHGGNRSGGN